MAERLALLLRAPFVWFGQQRNRWREWRRIHAEAVDVRVLAAIRDGHVHGLSIECATGLSPSSVYISLRRLEQGGWIAARWEDDPGCRPRHRLYALVDEGAER